MNILLLPGMDGTGVLFEPFVKAFPNSIDIQVATLIQEKYVNFEEQASALLGQVKNNTIIVAESYSGLIAHELGKLAPESINHVVFAASFLERPSILAKFGNLVPKAMLDYTLYPKPIVMLVLFGKYRSQYLMRLFERAMADVSLDLLEFRIKQLCNLHKVEHLSDIPATYLQAEDDRLVSSNAVEVFKKAYIHLNYKTVQGSHFVLQTNPKDTAQEVLTIAAERQK
jgi:pimeloyl-ACP methyl ester carboxylesterase